MYDMNTAKSPMTTITEVLETLRQRHQDLEFRYKNGQFATGRGKKYNPEDLTIVETYRFEGESNPEDMSIIYVIEANDGVVGYSLDVYGAESDQEEGYDDFIRKLKVERREK